MMPTTDAASPTTAVAFAPDFKRTDLAGSEVRLSAYRGKVVLLNFWASWCGPCLKEMPQLSAWQHDLGPAGLQIIGVSMDDSDVPVRRWLTAHPADYPIVLGDAELGRAFGGVLGLPCSFLIDRDGRIVARYGGAQPALPLRRKLRALLRSPVNNSP